MTIANIVRQYTKVFDETMPVDLWEALVRTISSLGRAASLIQDTEGNVDEDTAPNLGEILGDVLHDLIVTGVIADTDPIEKMLLRFKRDLEDVEPASGSMEDLIESIKVDINETLDIKFGGDLPQGKLKSEILEFVKETQQNMFKPQMKKNMAYRIDYSQGLKGTTRVTIWADRAFVESLCLGDYGKVSFEDGCTLLDIDPRFDPKDIVQYLENHTGVSVASEFSEA